MNSEMIQAIREFLSNKFITNDIVFHKTVLSADCDTFHFTVNDKPVHVGYSRYWNIAVKVNCEGVKLPYDDSLAKLENELLVLDGVLPIFGFM
jgi:hypothetical protein